MDHHKTSGRGRQGEDVVHEMHKRVLSATQIGLSRNPASAIRSGNTAVAITLFQFATTAKVAKETKGQRVISTTTVGEKESSACD